ncbi:MAG: DUF3158 family protein [Saezia sp.]
MRNDFHEAGVQRLQLFEPLQQEAFQIIKHGAFLKGLLKPFKGKGDMEEWASVCEGLRDKLISMAQKQVIRQTQSYPFSMLPVQLTLQTTGTGTTFLRWRNADKSLMGVALWEQMMASITTPSNLMAELYAIEQQRIVLNMQISLMHTLMRQARECAAKMQSAEEVFALQQHLRSSFMEMTMKEKRG